MIETYVVNLNVKNKSESVLGKWVILVTQPTSSTCAF